MKNCFLLGYLLVIFNSSLHATDTQKVFTPQEMLFSLCDGHLPKHSYQDGSAAKLAESLISQGASACAKDKYHDTPLHLAAKVGAYDVAEVLLKHGADPRAMDSMAENPFHTAARGKVSRSIDILLTHDKSLINVANGEGNTPLHLAAVHSNSKELIKHLINCGASKTQKNLENQTAEAYGREFSEDMANLIRDYSPAEHKNLD